MKTSHNLEFESRYNTRYPGYVEFRIGTCEGLYRHSLHDKAIEILAVVNRHKHNGHFKDVIEWFTHACIKENKKLRFCEVFNIRLLFNLYRHGYRRTKGKWLTLEKQF